jgi:hypothetical protein
MGICKGFGTFFRRGGEAAVGNVENLEGALFRSTLHPLAMLPVHPFEWLVITDAVPLTE